MKENWTPRPKVAAGGIAGVIALLCVVLRDRLGVELSAEEASLLTLVVTAGAAYMKRER